MSLFKKKTGVFVVLVFWLCLFWVFPSSLKASATIKIGALLDLSGPFSTLGATAFKSIRLAVENINLQGGIKGVPVEVLVYDTGADETRLVEGATELKRQGAVALIGPTAAKNCLLLRRFAENKRIPLMLIAGTSPVLTFSGIKTRWTFSTTLNFSSELKALFSVFQKRGYQNLGVLVQTGSFYKELFLWIRGYAPEYGLRLGCAEGFNLNQEDISGKVKYLNRCGPDIVLFWANSQAKPLIHGIMQYLDIPVGLSHTLYSANLIQPANSTSMLAFVAIPSALAPPGLKRSLSFNARNFLNSWGNELETIGFEQRLYAAQAWDGINVLTSGLKAGGAKGRSSLRYALENSVKDYFGVIGKFSYDKRDHSFLDPSSLQVLRCFNGHWSLVR